ncbi:hypothetical protein H0H93_002980 [Arthromyces matolae]|nr:hypothetical protein H0H93_002980 [Arthromyces matolae]
MQNKGTLSPGQSIVVNKFTVQVERYLSQGGFAHVYLVRTPNPVYNTTHHVLKRIAVANESMLAEVKKEVDVMRLLKGHPNIVHLIDAAWHQMPNGMYEVFILMEYCPGGGIIDMMNRRLRERLTEAEILQIFVDVCEGVACMHNLRPALLHRDLKVENILQSTPTSYKLCDFGSATTVSRPPATNQEIRALEADLNRHTTLQYRAPEMIDVYSRRPVDEKSDVWALGVLLYKLCYYTTPFEEHGQLAILNVQYRTPPYPIYSPQMNQLIASMLQEHGIRRPSVFEILTHVHGLRGTKSRFKYSIPVPQPLSPRFQTNFNSSLSSTGLSGLMSPPQSNRVTMSVSPSNGQGVQARDKGMNAVAPLPQGVLPSKVAETSTPSKAEPQPMRRGRPSTKDPHNQEQVQHLDNDRHRNAPTGVTGNEDAWTKTSSFEVATSPDAWRVDGKGPQLGSTNLGFGDDFVSKPEIIGAPDKPLTQSQLKTPVKSPPLPSPSRSPMPLGINKRPIQEKDAFSTLAFLPVEKPEPTLAEARKLRTGLATMHHNGFRTNPERPVGSVTRPSPSPKLLLTPQTHIYPTGNVSLTQEISTSYSPIKDTPTRADSISAESRFPSLEELDSGFPIPIPSKSITGVHVSSGGDGLSRSNGLLTRTDANDILVSSPRGYRAREATRSQQVTGIAMKEGQSSTKPALGLVPRETKLIGDLNSQTEANFGSKPNIPRSQGRITHNSHSGVSNPSTAPNLFVTEKKDPSAIARTAMHKEPRDWLTGDDDDEGPPPNETLIIRESPSKRASLIESSLVDVPSSAVTEHDHTPQPPYNSQISPTISKFTRNFPPVDSLDAPIKEPPVKPKPVAHPAFAHRREDSSDSGDEGPEDAVGIVRPTPKPRPKRNTSHKGRQSSVHELVDLYGGGHAQKERELVAARPFNSSPAQQIGENEPLKPHKPHFIPIPSPSNTLHPPSISDRLTRNGQHVSSPSERTPSPSRSRPQSMFIFPSKSAESFSLSPNQPSPSLGLTPPAEDMKRRNVRRTSISDIVQRYEHISNPTKATSNILPSSSTHTVVKSAGHAGNNARSPISEKVGMSSGSSLPKDDYVPSRRPKSPSGSHSPSSKLTSTRPVMNRKFGDSEHDISATPISSRPIPLRPDTFHKDPDVIPPSTSAFKSNPKFSPPSALDDSYHVDNGISSSPERPYQGVGRLIDQWQKKTAEAQASTTNAKGRERRALPDH